MQGTRIFPNKNNIKFNILTLFFKTDLLKYKKNRLPPKLFFINFMNSEIHGR